jgi:hypothetical protein
MLAHGFQVEQVLKIESAVPVAVKSKPVSFPLQKTNLSRSLTTQTKGRKGHLTKA